MAGIPVFFDGGDQNWPKSVSGVTSQRHPARLPWAPHDTDGVGPARSPRIPVLPPVGSRRRHKEMPRAGPARGGAILWTRIAFVRRRTRQRPGRTRHRMDPVGRTRSKRGDHGRKPPRRPRIGPSPRGAPARGGFSLRQGQPRLGDQRVRSTTGAEGAETLEGGDAVVDRHQVHHPVVFDLRAPFQIGGGAAAVLARGVVVAVRAEAHV